MDTDLSVIEPEQLHYLPAKTLLRLVEKSQTSAKNAKTFRTTVTALPELFRGLEAIDIEPGFNLDNEYITLSFTGDGKKLGEVWGLLRRYGFNTIQRPTKGSSEFYAFWEQQGHAQLFMCFTSSVCRRVQVGTKLVEQPVYETQCGELPELDRPASEVVVAEEMPF